MIAVALEKVGKEFPLYRKNNNEIRSYFFPFSKKKAEEFWALKDINMELEGGRVIGVIGRNGAGKSTLLDIISGVTVPTVGTVKINGRVSSMLALGVGFQRELTGRENIYLNSSILGMSKEQIDKKYRFIAEFSELGDFLNSSLKTYSSGMHLRLGFSVAIHVDFDILVVDEILSVGDVSFQKKCFDKIEEFRKAGKTMIIVSQDINIINRMCDEVFLLEEGMILEKGDSQKVTARYLELLKEQSNLSATFHRQSKDSVNWWADKRFWEKKEGSKEAEITGVELINSRGEKTDKFVSGEKVTLKAYFQAKENIEEPHFGVAIFREDGVYCYGPNSLFDGHRIDGLKEGKGWFSIEYESLSLMPGCYRFSVVIWDKAEVWAYDCHAGFYKFEVTGEHNDGQILNLRYLWSPDAGPQEIKIPPFIKQGASFNLNKEYRADDPLFSSVELVDLKGNSKDVFDTGEGVQLNLKCRPLEGAGEAYLWIGIFRSDDIYCHGAFRRFKENEYAVSLVYPSLPLLTGKYYISIGLWGGDKAEPLFYNHNALQFNMSYKGADHGTIYLKHSWKWELP